jgi:hypothetical protein
MGGSAQKFGDESDDDYITKHRPCRTIPSWPIMQFSLGKEVPSMATSLEGGSRASEILVIFLEQILFLTYMNDESHHGLHALRFLVEHLTGMWETPVIIMAYTRWQ